MIPLQMRTRQEKGLMGQGEVLLALRMRQVLVMLMLKDQASTLLIFLEEALVIPVLPVQVLAM